MRSFIALLSVLAATALAVPTVPPCLSEMCDPLGSAPAAAINAGLAAIDPTPTVETRSLSDAEESLTNAERLARGLPLKRPRRLQPGSPLRRDVPSSLPPVTYRGVLEVHNSANGDLIGYVSKNGVNGKNQAGIQAGIENALIVSFTLPSGQTSGSGLDMTYEQLDAFNGEHPYFGLIQGRDSTSSTMEPGNFNYGYYGGTEQTPKDSTPQLVGNSYSVGAPRTSESAVWSINLVTGSAVVEWTNPDGNKATITSWTQSTGLYFGGDQAAFFARYPAPVTGITLKFIPI